MTLLVILLFTTFILFTEKDRSVLFSRSRSFIFNDTERSYRVSVPKGDIKKIVVGLHGFGDTSRQFAYYTALHNAVDSSTLVVYPEASEPRSEKIKKGWNAGFCCGSGFLGGIDDSKFIASLVNELKVKYNSIDSKVYLTGFSNGAFMAQRLAIDYPSLVNGVAISSGSIGTTSKSLKPTSPMPILLLHGEKDEIVPIEGGVGSTDPDFNWLSFQETLSAWQAVNGTTTRTESITYPEDTHQWHNWRILNVWNKQPKASQEIIKFFDN